MTRDKFPGWVSMLDPDPLDAIPPEPDPPPRKRGTGTGCSWLAAALVIVLASSIVPAPSEAPELPSTARTLRGAPTAGDTTLTTVRKDVRGMSGSIGGSGGAPQPSGEVGTVLLGGWASWYDDPRKTGLYAAAGPLLREALGDWRGKVIRVTSGNRATLVQLSDWCACGERHGIPTIIDLSPDAFAELAPLAQGLVRVEIEVLALPATDTPDEHPFDPPEHPDDARMRLEDRDR